MPQKLDELKKTLAELTTAIKEKKQKGQDGDLDMDRLALEMKKIVDEKFDARGVGRKGEFDVGGTPAGNMRAVELVESAKDFDEMSDLLYLGGKICRKDVRGMDLYQEAKRRFEKAMDSATAEEGAEWVPTQFSPNLIEKVRLARKVADLHESFPMPSNPYKFPVEGGDPKAYLASESTSDTATKFTASTPGTTNITFTAAKLAVRVLISAEAEEDTVVPVLAHVRNKIVIALNEGEEEAILSGDTTGTHQDTDIHALGAADRRKAWKGYRKYALAAALATVDLGTFSAANLQKIRAAMGKYGVDPNKLAWVAGLKTYLTHFLGLSNVQTMDKYGPAATILSGELAKWDGIPIVVSQFSRENLNASGIQDGVTTDNGELELVYRPGFMIGEKRQIKVTVLNEMYAETDQIGIIATMREDFEPVYDTTAEAIIGLGYNIDCA